MAEIVSPPPVHVQPRRFTANEVLAMLHAGILHAGILHEDDRLELIDGQLIPPVSCW